MIEAEDPPDWNWSYASYAAPSRPWERAHLLVDRQHAVPGTSATIDNMGGLDVVYRPAPESGWTAGTLHRGGSATSRSLRNAVAAPS